MSLPTGLVWRSEFSPQHPGGAEKPRAQSNQTATVPGADPDTSTSTGQTGKQETAPPPPCGDSSMLWMMGAMFLVMYFFMIRPGQKQEKALKNMRSTLQMGDKVVTSSGMHGTILSVDEKSHTITLKTDEEGRVRMTFDQTAISRKANDEVDQDKA
ncbi:MAG: preprotein translocase subunit YajC [Pirellulaceae bacterium]|nr:preprotein translocase subunit YajC [Pirellulaceae bacterium]